jgi:hypothetical protein
MKKLLIVALIAISTSTAGTAWAQDPGAAGPTKRMRLGVDALIGLPLGDFGDLAEFAVGALVAFDFALMPQLTITGRTGYIYYIINEDLGDGFSFGTIPLWGGVKYYFAPPSDMRWFAAAELGLSINRASVEIGGIEGSDSETDIGTTIGGGFEIGGFSLRAQLAIIDIGEAGDSLMIAVTAGYYFLSF